MQNCDARPSPVVSGLARRFEPCFYGELNWKAFQLSDEMIVASFLRSVTSLQVCACSPLCDTVPTTSTHRAHHPPRPPPTVHHVVLAGPRREAGAAVRADRVLARAGLRLLDAQEHPRPARGGPEGKARGGHHPRLEREHQGALQ
eukprot:194936-Prymnesium_polylepis.2